MLQDECADGYGHHRGGLQAPALRRYHLEHANEQLLSIARRRCSNTTPTGLTIGMPLLIHRELTDFRNLCDVYDSSKRLVLDVALFGVYAVCNQPH